MPSKSAKRIEWITQPQAFFRELVTEAMGRQKVKAKPETEFYLVNLLNQFMTADRLFVQDADGSRREEPLVLMLKEALETSDREGQRALFRQVGDVSLYMAGFFQERLKKKAITVDYYIGMGGVAYGNVLSRLDDQGMRPVYQELSERFGNFVEVLSEVSQVAFPKSESDLLRVYEQWLSTGSQKAARILKDAGIEPSSMVGGAAKKNWQ
jgi:hypothetical protein